MFRALDKQLGHRYTSIIRENIATRYLELSFSSRRKGRRIEPAKHVVNYFRNGGWSLPGSGQVVADLIMFEMIGFWCGVRHKVSQLRHVFGLIYRR
jgi:hypothetical protein